MEFFFILSGCLMMHSIQKCSGEPEDLGCETAGFLKKKVASFLPEMLMAWSISFVLTVISRRLTGFDIATYFEQYSLELLLMTSVGLWEKVMNAPVWYLSSMILVMAVLYPLCRKYFDMMTKVILPLGVAISLGYLIRNYGHIRGPFNWVGFTTKGTIRAFAEISLGALIYPVSKKLASFSLTTAGKVAVTATENLLYLVILSYMCLVPYGKADFFFVFLFAFAIMLTFSGQGLDQKLFAHPIFSFLGKFSLYVYLCHYVYSRQIPALFPGMRDRWEMLLYFALSFLTASVVMLLSNLLRRHWETIRRRFSAVFISA